MITIRRATAADLSTVVDFLTRLAETLGYPLDPPSIEAGVRAVLTRPDLKSWYWLAESDGSPVGMLRVEVLWDDLRAAEVWHLQRLYVVPEHRRFGVATALHTHVRDRAARRGQVVRLTCHIHSWNKPCQELKDRLGWFRTIGPVYAADLATAAGDERVLPRAAGHMRLADAERGEVRGADPAKAGN